VCYVDPRSTFRIKRKGPDRAAHRAGKAIKVEKRPSFSRKSRLQPGLDRQANHKEFNQTHHELVPFLALENKSSGPEKGSAQSGPRTSFKLSYSILRLPGSRGRASAPSGFHSSLMATPLVCNSIIRAASWTIRAAACAEGMPRA
jgi:hypothetical protein